MEQTNELKKKYLKSYQLAVRREQEIIQEIERLRERKMFPALALPDGMPHGSGGHSDLSEYAVILDGEIDRLKQERLKQVQLYHNISRAIDRVKDANEQSVLRLKYIAGLTWEQVAVQMNYSWKQIHRIHARALDSFQIPPEKMT